MKNLRVMNIYTYSWTTPVLGWYQYSQSDELWSGKRTTIKENIHLVSSSQVICWPVWHHCDQTSSHTRQHSFVSFRRHLACNKTCEDTIHFPQFQCLEKTLRAQHMTMLIEWWLRISKYMHMYSIQLHTYVYMNCFIWIHNLYGYQYSVCIKPVPYCRSVTTTLKHLCVGAAKHNCKASIIISVYWHVQ